MDSHKEVTEHEKMQAIESLKKDILGYVENQNTQFEWHKKQYVWQRKVTRWMGGISILSSLTVLIGLVFLIYTISKPLPATIFDMKYVRDQNALLSIREKAFEQKKEVDNKVLADREAAFILEKSKHDSDLAERRKDVIKMLDKTKK